MTKNKKGFTLVELLVVVLIIGVLAAIALPMYQKAVLKSRFAALMPIAKAMADSNEAYYLEHTQYASNPQDLPVQGQLEYPTGTEIELAPGLEYAYVMASNDLARNNYIVYQKHSTKFADNIHCEALEDDEQANGVCISLGGQLINGSLTDGYKTYVLSGTYGETDKLPSSLTKLAKTICANVSEEECIIDDNARTITTRECELNASTNTVNCVSTRYNDSEELLDQTKLMCRYGTTPNAQGTRCTGSPNSTTSWYETRDVYDGTNRQFLARSCTDITNNECTSTNERIREYWPNSDKMKSEDNHTCAMADLQEDGGCSAYTVLRGINSASGEQMKYNEQGRQTWEARCTHLNPDGTCTSMTSGRVDTYDTTGIWSNGVIWASCTMSHLSDTNPCTEYSLTYHGSASGPDTCPANRFNLDTFACAPES